MTEFKCVPVVPTEAMIDAMADHAADTGCFSLARQTLKGIFVTAIQASPAHDGEVIYQYRITDSSNWHTCSKERFDKGKDVKGIELRTLYTAPPRVVDEAMVKRACNAYDNQLDNLLYLESLAIYPAMHAALKAALEKQ